MSKEYDKYIKYKHMTKEELIRAVDKTLEENKQLKERIDKAIEYIEKCIKLSPTEHRTKTDETLDIEYKYILKLLKGNK